MRVFYAYLPRKRHRLHMRAFEDCFTGSEAVDWLWDYLKQTEAFGKNVSRQQTVLLCQKLMASKVYMQPRLEYRFCVTRTRVFVLP